jgi:hypothetical protein
LSYLFRVTVYNIFSYIYLYLQLITIYQPVLRKHLTRGHLSQLSEKLPKSLPPSQEEAKKKGWSWRSGNDTKPV